MRVLVASLFVIGLVGAAVAVLGMAGVLDRRPPALVGLGLGVFFVALCVAALVLFNPWWADPLRRKTDDQLLSDLDDAGLLESTDFRARRALRVDETDDEGPHYFLELADGRVLYLSGQYVYDYEPITDDPELNQPRQFPCTEFTVRRHKSEGHVVDLVCRSQVFEPECVRLGARTRRTWRSMGYPEDGQVMADRPYDLLKELLGQDAD